MCYPLRSVNPRGLICHFDRPLHRRDPRRRALSIGRCACCSGITLCALVFTKETTNVSSDGRKTSDKKIIGQEEVTSNSTPERITFLNKVMSRHCH